MHIREPFEDLEPRIRVGSDEEVFKPHREQHISKCKHCGNDTIPIQFLNKLPSYFICVKCQLPQPNLEHPIFKEKDKPKEEIEQEIADAKMQNRRTARAKLDTIKSHSDNPEQLVEQVSEKGMRANIRKGSITQQTEPDMRDSHFEVTAEINVRTSEPISSQVQYAIQKSVEQVQNYQHNKESHDKRFVNELRRGKA